MNPQKKVILHTDIANDMDDSWALAMLLNQPWLDLQYVLVDTQPVEKRVRCIAKMLDIAKRTDIEIGIGLPTNGKIEPPSTIEPWYADYALADYQGKIYNDGVRRLMDILNNSEESMTVISIGPCPALAEAARQQPDVFCRHDFVGMFGSIYVGYNGGTPCPEYNVLSDITACQTVFKAQWKSRTITPLDSCDKIALDAQQMAKIKNSNNRLLQAILKQFDIFMQYMKKSPADYQNCSSILYDTVAIHLASTTDFLNMQMLNISIDDNGYSKINNDNGVPVNVAIGWNNLDAFRNLLCETLLK